MSVVHTAVRQDPLRTTREFSAQVGWSESTIYRKRSLGESLPRALKLGSAVRWRQSDIDAWLDAQSED